MKILLIEDNPDHVLVAKRILGKHQGLSLDVASDCTQASEKLAAGGYDVILCDYRLPCSSAMEVLRGLKKEGKDIPFIVTTSAGNEKVAVELIQEGAYDYIIKDDTFEDTLPLVINRALEKYRMMEERRKIEDDLRASEEKYRALVENLPAAVYLSPVGDPAVSMYVSAQIETILGFTSEDFAADRQLWFKRVHPDDRDMVTDFLMRACSSGANGAITVEYRMLARDNRTVWVQDRVRVILDKTGKPSYLHGLMTDITQLKQAQKELQDAYMELKRTQQELIQSSKMVALGQLATGISHELNQPLTGIKGFAQAMLMDMDKDHPFRRDVEKIVEQSNRMEKIIKNVRFFARKSEFELKDIDCNKPLEDALMLLSEQLKLHTIRLKKELAPDLPMIQADHNALQQAFINILTNARDAIDGLKRPEGGDILVKSTWDRKQDSVVMRIEDNGCGISRENLKSIFNPFFTTKAPDRGIGLGLSIVYRIVENHGGKIDIDSTEGKGTSVVLSFPAHRGAGAGGSAGVTAAAPQEAPSR
jgi:PAS domain S-box-containing protein